MFFANLDPINLKLTFDPGVIKTTKCLMESPGLEPINPPGWSRRRFIKPLHFSVISPSSPPWSQGRGVDEPMSRGSKLTLGVLSFPGVKWGSLDLGGPGGGNKCHFWDPPIFGTPKVKNFKKIFKKKCSIYKGKMDFLKKKWKISLIFFDQKWPFLHFF